MSDQLRQSRVKGMYQRASRAQATRRRRIRQRVVWRDYVAVSAFALGLLSASGVTPLAAAASDLLAPGDFVKLAEHHEAAYLPGRLEPVMSRFSFKRTPGLTQQGLQEEMHFSVVLGYRDVEGLDRHLAEVLDPRSSQFRQFLSSEQFHEQHGLRESETALVIQHLTAHGIRHLPQESPHSGVLSFAGTPQQIEDTFLTPVIDYQVLEESDSHHLQVKTPQHQLLLGHQNRKIYHFEATSALPRTPRLVRGIKDAPSVPAVIAPFIHAIVGLNEFSANRRMGGLQKTPIHIKRRSSHHLQRSQETQESQVGEKGVRGQAAGGEAAERPDDEGDEQWRCLAPSSTASSVPRRRGWWAFESQGQTESQPASSCESPFTAPADAIAFEGSSASLGLITPPVLRKAYGLDQLAQQGAGQTLALFELADYSDQDIQDYLANTVWPFPKPYPRVTRVRPRSLQAPSGGNSLEVVLDIELALAAAPRLKEILVYQAAAGSNANIIALYGQIAAEHRASVVSTSWGSPEVVGAAGPTPFALALQAIFKRMALQGQTVFAAAGDNGAYGNDQAASTPTVDEPASQPYVTGVGGTTLTLNSDGTYGSESSWGLTSTGQSDGSRFSQMNGRAGGGGGGVSRYWPLPQFQEGLATANNRVSSERRNVPDVALNAATPYLVLFTDGSGVQQWTGVGGTSAAAPIWAGFAACVNQALADAHRGPLGYFNPLLYELGQAPDAFSRSFYSVSDQSNNLLFPAEKDAYNDSVGWGSFRAPGLLQAIVEALPSAAGALDQALPAGVVDVAPSPPQGPSFFPALWSRLIAWLSQSKFFGARPAAPQAMGEL